jgi:hypothetical protein
MNSESQTTPAASNYRWVICGLLFFATNCNYMDRQILAVIKPIMLSGQFRCAGPISSRANPADQGFPAL